MAKVIQAPQNDIIDVNLSAIRKKRFRIDGDDNRILELNTSDLNMLARLKEAYPRLMELTDKTFTKLPEPKSSADDYNFLEDADTTAVIQTLTEADKEMRDLMDYIFDSNVSEICAPDGSMFDPIGGTLRFEHIISALSPLYESDIETEMKNISNRVKKHTDKYRKRGK